MVEIILKVGKKGEIYTTKTIRKLTKIRVGGYVKAEVIEGKLILEPVKTVEDLLKKPKKIELTVEEFENFSLEAQREILGDA